jgi:protein-L-isoaspartate(D-aspartate) O-methyltransferase
VETGGKSKEHAPGKACLGFLLPILLGFLFCSHLPAASADPFSERRARMVAEIEQDVRETRFFLGKDTLDPRTREALLQVPRHRFVPAHLQDAAYENRPLPIGEGQTISQPYIVAIMTDLLRLEPDDVVFELGTGSGYQAAVLAQLVEKVYSVEILPVLAERAQRTLQELGYRNISVRLGDGYFGWPEHAPFDAIVVTAASDHIPPPLVQQLKPGGRMILPVGSRFLIQQLVLVEKGATGEVRTQSLLPVNFVPLTGGH